MKEAKLQVVKFENADVIATSGFNPNAATFYLPDNIRPSGKYSFDFTNVGGVREQLNNVGLIFAVNDDRIIGYEGSSYDTTSRNITYAGAYSTDKSNAATSIEDVLEWIRCHGVAGKGSTPQ